MGLGSGDRRRLPSCGILTRRRGCRIQGTVVVQLDGEFSMNLLQLGDARPEVAADAFVADTARVIGRVSLGQGSSVWYGAVLRGDNEPIVIGARSNVQEGAVLHTDPGFPLVVAEGVTIGHQAVLHGCTVGAGSLIGIAAVVLNGARIGRDCLVGAGALVTEGKEFPDGSLIIGSPARAVRQLSPEQIEGLRRNAAVYVERGALFARALREPQA
jgi:carbonic anhydrase/acetyltransferase-like protein (isoleucine patch superfamily)